MPLNYAPWDSSCTYTDRAVHERRNTSLILFSQILMSALVIMVDAIKLVPTTLGATTAPV